MVKPHCSNFRIITAIFSGVQIFLILTVMTIFFQRVQSGEHYTVASTHKNELLYWGLRFKEPGPYMEDSESKSSTNGSLMNKDDLRVESVTPRNASHSRQTSISSVNSLTSKSISAIFWHGKVMY